MLALAGCAAAAPTTTPTATATPTVAPTPTPIPHATGASDVLVQVETRGGFAPEILSRTVNPDFTLYGDGTLLYRVYDAARSSYGPRQARLSEEAIQEVLRRAIDDARFFDSLDFYGNPYVLDAGTTRITVETAEGCRSVYAYALGFDLPPSPAGMTVEDVAQLARLTELHQWLLRVGVDTLGREGWEDEGAFTPETMNLFISPIPPDSTLHETLPWPFPIIDLLFFASQPNPPAQMYLDDDLARDVYRFLNGTVVTVFSHGEGLYYVTYRPHLPSEEQWRDRDLCTGETLP